MSQPFKRKQEGAVSSPQPAPIINSALSPSKEDCGCEPDCGPCAAATPYSSGGYDIMVRNQNTGACQTISSGVVAPVYNFNNGLTKGSNNLVQLGGPLVKDTTINLGSFGLTIIGNLGTAPASYFQLSSTSAIFGSTTPITGGVRQASIGGNVNTATMNYTVTGGVGGNISSTSAVAENNYTVQTSAGNIGPNRELLFDQFGVNKFTDGYGGGLSYAASYVLTQTYGDRWIPDLGAVKALIPNTTVYVPYLGAINDIVLGAHNLSAQDLNATRNATVASILTIGPPQSRLALGNGLVGGNDGNAVSAWAMTGDTTKSQWITYNTLGNDGSGTYQFGLNFNRTVGAESFSFGKFNTYNWATINASGITSPSFASDNGLSGTARRYAGMGYNIGGGSPSVDLYVGASFSSYRYNLLLYSDGANTFSILPPNRPFSANNSVTFRDLSGTVALLSDITGGGGTVTSVSGVANRTTSTGGATPIIDIAATYLGQSSITTLGTIISGVWNAGVITDTYISSATIWNAKQAALISGTNIKTVNGGSLLGSGNLAVGDELVANKVTSFGTVNNTLYPTTQAVSDYVASNINGALVKKIDLVGGVGDSMTAGGQYLTRIVSDIGGTGWGFNTFGIAGDRTSGVLAKIGLTTSGNYNTVVALCGINDIFAGISTSVIQANLQAIYTALHNAGIKVIASTILPCSNYSGWNSTVQSAITIVNSWIKTTAINVDAVVDAYTLMADPTNPTALDPAFANADQLHPSDPAGYSRLGDFYYAAITWVKKNFVYNINVGSDTRINQNLSTGDNVSFQRVNTSQLIITNDRQYSIPWPAMATTLVTGVQTPTEAGAFYDTDKHLPGFYDGTSPRYLVWNGQATSLTINSDIIASSLYNSTSINNAYIQPSTTGVKVQRNVADAIAAFTATQVNTGSTGNIQNWQFGANVQTAMTYRGYLSIGASTTTSLLNVQQSTQGTGTISNSAGGTTVTGVGTIFTNTFKIGQTITANGETHTISAIASNTSMTTDAWTGANSGVAYTLVGGSRLTVNGNGDVNIANLTASVPVFTDANKNLTSTGIVPIASGGTGSATQNWVDLNTTQASIAGIKTWTAQNNFSGSYTGTVAGTQSAVNLAGGTLTAFANNDVLAGVYIKTTTYNDNSKTGVAHRDLYFQSSTAIIDGNGTISFNNGSGVNFNNNSNSLGTWQMNYQIPAGSIANQKSSPYTSYGANMFVGSNTDRFAYIQNVASTTVAGAAALSIFVNGPNSYNTTGATLGFTLNQAGTVAFPVYTTNGILMSSGSNGTIVVGIANADYQSIYHSTNTSSISGTTYTVTTTDEYLWFDSTSNTIAVTLMTPVGIKGKRYSFKRINTGANNVTITPSAGTIDGASSYALSAQWKILTIYSNGINWLIEFNN